MTTTLIPLKWETVINGRKKIATTHFGTVYTIEKIESLGGWVTKITVPRAGTEVLVKGVSFATSRKVATDDYVSNGGR